MSTQAVSILDLLASTLILTSIRNRDKWLFYPSMASGIHTNNKLVMIIPLQLSCCRPLHLNNYTCTTMVDLDTWILLWIVLLYQCPLIRPSDQSKWSVVTLSYIDPSIHCTDCYDDGLPSPQLQRGTLLWELTHAAMDPPVPSNWYYLWDSEDPLDFKKRWIPHEFKVNTEFGPCRGEVMVFRLWCLQ